MSWFWVMVKVVAVVFVVMVVVVVAMLSMTLVAVKLVVTRRKTTVTLIDNINRTLCKN